LKRGKNIKHIIILGVTFIALVMLELLSPKELDWTLYLSKESKNPLGSYAIHTCITDIFPSSKIINNYQTLYEYFGQNKLPKKATMVFVSEEFAPDSLDMNLILKFLEEGNHVFISSVTYGKEFCDTLNIETQIHWLDINTKLSDSVRVQFANQNLATAPAIYYSKAYFNSFFSKVDTAHTTILGYQNEKFTNFIKVKIGEGELFLHTQPIAFTNYQFLLRNNSEYVEKMLSLLPNSTVIWDEYYKPNKLIEETPLRYILKNKSLRTAYWLLWVGLAFFFLFEIKRKQRIIPIVAPPKNTSLEFTETIGRLYLHSRNHHDLASKKIMYFLEFLRNSYFLNIKLNEPIDYQKISEKTRVDTQTITKLFNYMQVIQNSSKLSDYDLLQFSNLIEDFYTKCK